MNSGELLNQLLIDLQSLFRTSFRKKKIYSFSNKLNFFNSY